MIGVPWNLKLQEMIQSLPIPGVCSHQVPPGTAVMTHPKIEGEEIQISF